MAEKDSSQHSWTDPKDFGLPPVDLAPIGKTSVKKVEKKEEVVPKAAPLPKEEKSSEDKILAAKAMAVQKAEAQKIEETTQIVASEEKVTSPPPKKEIPKKSNSWVLWVVLIGLALVSAIIWQLVKEEPIDPVSEEVLAENVEETAQPEENSPGPVTNTAEENPTESIDQPEESEESVQNPPVEENPAVEVPQNTESGTTIDQSSPGELIRVETKPIPSQYFIIVGSLPNERLALNEASKYWDRNSELFLLSPNEDSNNYRLAIGRFSGFTPANAELQRVKDEYTEALWILKY